MTDYMAENENSVATVSNHEAAAQAPTPRVAVAQKKPGHRPVRVIVIAVIAVIAVVGVAYLVYEALTTVSTDDAYVNGHVTYVAPRVAGQVTRVLVDDNNRVHKGDLLVQLDPEPYQVQVNIAQASLDVANADLVSARRMRGQSWASREACVLRSITRSKTWTIRWRCCIRESRRWIPRRQRL